MPAHPDPTPLPKPPAPLPPDLRADLADRRARGDSWDAIAAALRYDTDALRRAGAADPAFAAEQERAWAEAAREAEAAAVRRLQKLTGSEDEKVALRAAEVLLRYARERRKDEGRVVAEQARARRAEGTAVAAATGQKPSPAARPAAVRVPPGLAERPAAAPAFRAVPDAAAHFLGGAPNVPPVLSVT